MASDRPSSDIVFSVKPNASTATNDAMTDTGSARPVMTVERQELRNRKTVSTVSTAPSMSAVCDVGDRVGHALAGVADEVQLDARRQRLRDVVDLRPAPPSATCRRAVALGLLDVDADRVLRREQRLRARLFDADVDRGDVAEPDRRGRCGWRRRSARSSADFGTRPPRRIVRSSCTPSSRPTGAARFCAESAPTTSPMLTLAAVSASGRTSTVISRVLRAGTVRPRRRRRCARSRRVMPGSASSVSCATDIVFDASASETIGKVRRVDPREDRLLHLRRQVVPDGVDLVANLLRGFLQVLFVR